LTHSIKQKLDVYDCSLTHLTLRLSLHYLVKCRSHSLAIYNNGLILGSTCILTKIIN